MKEFQIKLFGLRKISFSRFEDNLILVIYTARNVKVKRISSPFVFHWRKTLAVAAGVFFMSMASLAASIVYMTRDDTHIVQEEDEKLKDSIVYSEETNYSDPEDSSTLKISQYKVKDGDTLGEIAKEYGVSVDTICGSNKLPSYDIIHAGQVLNIPNKDGLVYKIKKGDTIQRIASNYKVNADKIAAENNLTHTTVLTAGTEIFIPDAKPQNIIAAFMWPVSSRRITSSFGWRVHPIRGGRHFHSGIDIGVVFAPVRASKYGKVTYAGWMGGYGNAVVIAHPGGHKTLYGHLSRIYVRRGQYVKQGQGIAQSGNSGLSSGPHLHFEIIRNGNTVNPRKYLR